MNIQKRYQITLSDSDIEILNPLYRALTECEGINQDWVLLHGLHNDSPMDLTQLNATVKILESYVCNYPQIQDILTDLYRITEHEQL